jgi:hypothetical protein
MRHYQKTNICTTIKGKNDMIATGDEENRTQEFIKIPAFSSDGHLAS